MKKQNEQKNIPFDLQRAQKGSKVVTEHNHEVIMGGYNPDAVRFQQLAVWVPIFATYQLRGFDIHGKSEPVKDSEGVSQLYMAETAEEENKRLYMHVQVEQQPAYKSPIRHMLQWLEEQWIFAAADDETRTVKNKPLTDFILKARKKAEELISLPPLITDESGQNHDLVGAYIPADNEDSPPWMEYTKGLDRYVKYAIYPSQLADLWEKAVKSVDEIHAEFRENVKKLDPEADRQRVSEWASRQPIEPKNIHTENDLDRIADFLNSGKLNATKLKSEVYLQSIDNTLKEILYTLKVK
jgi:hypothetical protein